MRFVPILISSCAAIALASCGGSGSDAKEQPKVAAVAATDGASWTQTITETADGGFVMGNPDAPITLVEYGSLTCGHCKAFADAADEELYNDFIATGKVAFEFRNYLLHPADAIGAAIMTCGGKDRYYPLMKNIYANQGEFIETAMKNSEQTPPDLAALPDNQKFIALGKYFSMDAFFGARGFGAQDINQCLSKSENVLAVQNKSNQASSEYEVSGTPTFMINGTVIRDANTWPAIKERLQAAGAR